jgi:hypothetical protein
VNQVGGGTPYNGSAKTAFQHVYEVLLPFSKQRSSFVSSVQTWP